VKLSIISWNIRHLRLEKATDETNRKHFINGLADGHIVFLYENKLTRNENSELRSALKEILTSARENPQHVYVEGIRIEVGTNELVHVVYTAVRPTGKKSDFGPGKEIRIAVNPNHNWDAELRSSGWKALQDFRSDTVISNISSEKLGLGHGYRIPAVVDVRIIKPDRSERTLTIAGWHAPGPSMATAPTLFNAYAEVLRNVDLFVGDFNYNPDTRYSPAECVGEVLLHKISGSTTIRDDGSPVQHTQGPDLVYRNKKTTTTLAGKEEKRVFHFGKKKGVRNKPLKVYVNRICIGNAEIREGDVDLGEELFRLSDHRPVVVTLRRL